MLPLKPIIVVTQARSGSTLLQSYLGQIPGVASFNEIFRSNNPVDLDRIAKTISLSSQDLEQLRKLQTENLAAFWAFFSQLLLAEEIRPAAKIFYAHADASDAIWIGFRRAQVIQLIRENVLASVVSLKIAHRSGQWQLRRAAERFDTEPIEISKRDCEHHLSDLRYNVNWVREKYSSGTYAEIAYDDLSDIEVAEAMLSSILSEKIVLQRQPLLRQREKPLREIVTNYEEVERFDRNFSFVART